MKLLGEELLQPSTPKSSKKTFRRATLKESICSCRAKNIKNQVKLDSLLAFIYSDCFSVFFFTNDVL